MSSDVRTQKLVVEILKILEESLHRGPLGSRKIARELNKRGFKVGERAVRYHLKFLDERGYTKKVGSLEGRVITDRGLEEIRSALVELRIGFVLSKIENLMYAMTYDLSRDEGLVVVNTTFVDEASLNKALKVMKKVMDAGYATSPLIKLAHQDEMLAGILVPRKKVGIATVCSITLDGLLVKAGIPVSPKFGGLLEIDGGVPIRFVDAIAYHSSSVDPLEVFAARRLTSIVSVVERGDGRVLANLREIPMAARAHAEEVLNTAKDRGFSGLIAVGKPNEPLYGLPINMGMVGIAMMGGINPVVALEEAGIRAESSAIEGLLNKKELAPVSEFA